MQAWIHAYTHLHLHTPTPTHTHTYTYIHLHIHTPHHTLWKVSTVHTTPVYLSMSSHSNQPDVLRNLMSVQVCVCVCVYTSCMYVYVYVCVCVCVCMYMPVHYPFFIRHIIKLLNRTSWTDLTNISNSTGTYICFICYPVNVWNDLFSNYIVRYIISAHIKHTYICTHTHTHTNTPTNTCSIPQNFNQFMLTRVWQYCCF